LTTSTILRKLGMESDVEIQPTSAVDVVPLYSFPEIGPVKSRLVTILMLVALASVKQAEYQP
jgi:hypothetical protein